MELVGFNYLLNKEIKIMKIVLYKVDSCGYVNYGWLDSYYIFSFVNYYNLDWVYFGVLWVLNDDIVVLGRGFGCYFYDNMEIVLIFLVGVFEY